MITIAAPKKPHGSIASGCVLGASRVGIIQVRANRRTVRTRASNKGTSVKSTHLDALLHTTRFSSVTHVVACGEDVHQK